MNELMSVGITERKRGKWVEIPYYANSCNEEQGFIIGSLGNWEGRNVAMNLSQKACSKCMVAYTVLNLG